MNILRCTSWTQMKRRNMEASFCLLVAMSHASLIQQCAKEKQSMNAHPKH